jgi:hypothetical protein
MANILEDEIDAPKPTGDWVKAEDDGTDEFEEAGDLEDSDDAADLDETDDAVVEIDGDTEALEQLEAEELEMLTEDEAAESLPVDEAEELRQIRRAAMSLESAADSAAEDEFVCGSCFLVKAGSQLADKRKKLCRDCA